MPIRRFMLIAVSVTLSCSACDFGASSTAPISSGPVAPTTPSLESPIPTVGCVDRVFDDMTEEQRVGQLFIVGLGNDELGDAELAGIRSDHFGSVSFIQTTTSGRTSVRRVANAVQALGSPETTANVGFFVAANQEGGQIQALRGEGFSEIPSAVDQGQLDPSLLREDAARWGRQLRKAGVNLNFAPVMDVVPSGSEDQNQPIGVLRREYGNDPNVVGSHGVAFLEGMEQAGVATTAKHFPGLGRVRGNTDFAAHVVDDITREDDPYLQPFQQAVDAGVPFVMVALATYTRIDPAHLAVFSPRVMRILRHGLSFDGVIVSDDLGEAEAVSQLPPGDRAVDFLEAGGDMIISKTVTPALAMWAAIESRVAVDAGFRDRVAASVRRILQAKEAIGLLPCAGP